MYVTELWQLFFFGGSWEFRDCLSVEQLEVLKARFGVCLAIHLLQKVSGLLDYLTQSILCANETDENCV